MGIFSRLTDIINSNLNSILDRAEDPEKIIRLVIQEMEDTLVEVRSTAAKTIAEKKESARKLGRLEDAQRNWEEKAELALSKGREDLAKGALVEKAKMAEAAELLKEELEELDAMLAQGEADIAKLESKLREAKAKQQALTARHETASSRLKVRRNLYDGRVDEAFARFEQVEKKLDEAEGEVEAFDLGRGKSLAEEISELAAESAIEDELAALKAKVAAGKAGPKAAPKSADGE
ncbi:phage shock protein PspA [Pelagibius marinus]|uniref:phage shock protein PspA n=1 Tax=Pelagibius marinus TaxID=2762760 RepID=UPI001873182C|nr:phage shock protein PspA [Pelagibius marinus]